MPFRDLPITCRTGADIVRLPGHTVARKRLPTNRVTSQFQVTTASGTAECAVVPPLMDGLSERRFHRKTVGLDRGYGPRDLVARLRAKQITPHVAQNTGRKNSSAG